MAPPPVAFACRGTDGVDLREAPSGSLIKHLDDAHSKCSAYSPDGRYFAYATADSVTIIDAASGDALHKLERRAVLRLQWACTSTHLTTYEMYFTKEKGVAGEDNVRVWSMKTGGQSLSYICKRVSEWWPQWTSDGEVCGRLITNGVQFYKGSDLEDGVQHKCAMDNAADFAFANGAGAPYRVAVFSKSTKSGPCMVKIFVYGRFDTPLATKSFFKADHVNLLWNNQGNALLIHTETEKDSTGKSYYGETGLHYMTANGNFTCTVQLDKGGPIYACDWCPTSTDFAVVYGYMPARTCIFDSKCNIKIDLNTGSRNNLAYAPQGHLLCLYGTGNLRGVVEIFEPASGRQVGNFKAEDSTTLEWFPDGHHILTATCAPRLRQGNGFKVWRIDGHLVHVTEVPNPRELWEAVTRKAALGTYAIKALPSLDKSKAIKTQPVKVAAYRPPGSSGKPAFKLHDDPKPSTPVSKFGSGAQPAGQTIDKEKLSKSALKRLKNKEKAEREKAADGAGKATAETKDGKVGGFVPSAGSTQVQLPAGAQPDLDVGKQIKKLKKTLRAVEQLKADKAGGKALEANQLAKLASEESLRKELEQLELKA